MADNIWNGAGLGAAFGVLVASSSISFIVSIVDAVSGVIPDAYGGTYTKYIVFGILGAIVGAIIDKK